MQTTTKPKHTPGPWAIGDTTGGAICLYGDATVCGDGFTLNDADRALIAAAPELLAACDAVVAAMSGGDYGVAFDAVRAAVAKARGQA